MTNQAKPARKRGKSTAAPGVRGPRGRPWTNVRALTRQHSAEAVARLAELMYDDNPCVAVAAARAVLDRGNGKVPVRLKHMGKRRKPEPLEPPMPDVKITRFRERQDDGK